MSVSIRRLGTEDATILSGAVRALVKPDGAAGASHLSKALSDRGCFFIVGLEGDDAVGYLSAFRFPSVEEDGDLVYLYDLVVREDRRRRGIARRLIEALVRACRADGVVRIWAGTSGDNRPAQALFAATGAARVSETYTEYVYDLTREASGP